MRCMPLFIVALVLSAAAFHAAWNAILKSQPDHSAGLFAQLTAAGIIAAIGATIYGAPPREAWMWLAMGEAPRLCYYYFLAATYRRGDVSVFYPVLRGAAAPLAAAGGFIFLGESPSLIAIIGIVLVSVGILWTTNFRGARKDALLFALATSFCIASYSLIDANGVRISGNAAQYVFWAMLLDAICFLPPMVLWGKRRRLLRSLSVRQWCAGAIGGALSVAAYGLVLYAYARTQVGLVAALRETSVVFGAMLGMLFLGETKSAARIVGAIIIASGAALIAAS